MPVFQCESPFRATLHSHSLQNHFPVSSRSVAHSGETLALASDCSRGSAREAGVTLWVLDKRSLPAYIAKNSCLSQSPRVPCMKNVYEVLRQKEMELGRLEKEVEALRLVAPLLSEEKEVSPDGVKPALAAAAPSAQQPIRIPQPAIAAPNPQPARAAGWEDTAKRWP